MNSMKSISLTASIIADPSKVQQLDMLMGVHPSELRFLFEEEELHRLLHYVKRADLMQGEGKVYRDAKMWHENFPEIREVMAHRNIQELYNRLWDSTLRKAKIVKLAYAFYPANGIQSLEEYKSVREAAKRIQKEFADSIGLDPKFKDKTGWTGSFPADGPLGKIIEQKSGLSQDIKSRVGLRSQSPGLLCNYLLSRGALMEQELTPYQFEDLVGSLFEDDGWEVEITSKSRDGGKDIVAKRENAGNPTIAYIEAKKNAQTRKINISQVKEFVATVAADNVGSGFMVTTSHFSKPAIQWLENKGSALATIELINRKRLVEKMEKIANSKIAAYLKTKGMRMIWEQRLPITHLKS